MPSHISKNKKGGKPDVQPEGLLTNKRSKIPKRTAGEMYRSERFGVYLGLNISLEMQTELVEGAKKALMRQSDFARLIMKDGLRVWRATQGRAFRDGPPAEGET